MIRRALPLAVALVTAGALAMPPGVMAQGNGRPKAPRADTPSPPPAQTPNPSPLPAPLPTSPLPPVASPAPPSNGPASPATSVPASVTLTDGLAPVSTFRQFGAWLDDASAADQGNGYVSIGAGYWRLPGISQVNVPMLGAGIGVTDRFQVNASVPFYRYTFDGTSVRGLDDVYISAKYTILDPSLTISEFGLAVTPVVEVLSAGFPDGRLHFAVPVSMEIRREPFRVYGSAGYFTRGSLFSGGAIEWTSPAAIVLTGAVTQSYSMKEDPVLDSWAVARQRVDVAASIARAVGNAAAVYVSIGRSLNSPPEWQTSLSLMGGVSFRFNAARSVP